MMRVKRAFIFAGDRLKFLVYKKRKQICLRNIENIF